MMSTRIKEFELNYNRTIEQYLQDFLNIERFKSGNYPEHLKTPALLIKYFRSPKYSPPKMEVFKEARKQQFAPIFRKRTSENSFSGISSYVAKRTTKTLNWYPPSHSSEEMSEAELDKFVDEKIVELEAVLEGKVPAGVYACDIDKSCFSEKDSSTAWSLKAFTSRFSACCKKNPNRKISTVKGLKNLTYVSEKNTISPLHIEDGDLWSINYHWKGSPKLWIVFEYTSLMPYVESVRKDLDGKFFSLLHVFLHSNVCILNTIPAKSE